MTSKEKSEFRRSKEWKNFRADFAETKGYQCQMCGTKWSGLNRSAQVHHIEPDKYDNLDYSRFALLCASCHETVEKMIRKVNAKKVNILNINAWKDLIYNFLDGLTKQKLNTMIKEKKMIYQTDFKGVVDDIADYGCFFMTLIKIARPELIEKGDMDAIKASYDFLKFNGTIGKECYINNIYNVLDFLGNKVEYVGKFSVDYVLGKDELCIEYWQKPGYSHFITHDYDPIRGGSNTRRQGKMMEKRIFKIR